MRFKSIRILALLLVLATLLQPAALATGTQTTPTEDTTPSTEETTPTEPTPTEPEFEYVFPDDWRRAPLMFVVEHGIFIGDTNGDLRPADTMTRAELATVLVRMLGLTKEGDVSAFTDLNPNSWYYPYIAKAYAAGLFNGITETIMAPDDPLTRQQAFAVLCRAFGIYTADQTAYTVFTDADRISNYAKGHVSAMYLKGIVRGYKDGSLCPLNNINRAEIAQLLYGIFDDIVTTVEDIPETGRILYQGTDSLPAGLTHTGTLILTPQLAGTIALDALTVHGDLVLRCANGSQITLTDLTTDNLLCVLNDAAITAAGDIAAVHLQGSRNTLTVDAPKLYVHNGNDSVVSGTYETVYHYGGTFTFAGHCDTLYVQGGTALVLNGTVEHLVIESENVTISGSGYAKNVDNYGRNTKISLSYGSYTEHVDYGLSGVSLSISGDTLVTEPKTNLSFTVTIQGGTYTGLGLTNGKRLCTLTWYHNGVQVSQVQNFAVYNGATATCTIPVDTQVDEMVNDILEVTLTYQEETVRAKADIQVDTYSWYYNRALTDVDTAYVKVTLNANLNLYADRNKTQYITTLPAGTVVYNEYHPKQGTMQVTTADGTTGWLNSYYVTVSKAACTDSTTDYMLGTKEGFVNLKGYSSSTEYLIWVSRYTQHVNIYKGSQGNWKLIKTFLCSSGKNYTPTPAGVFRIFRYSRTWYFDDYYADYAVSFNGGHAFHTMPLNYGSGTPYDATMGSPASDGCVRLDPVNAQYIYENIPIGTTVVIY